MIIIWIIVAASIGLTIGWYIGNWWAESCYQPLINELYQENTELIQKLEGMKNPMIREEWNDRMVMEAEEIFLDDLYSPTWKRPADVPDKAEVEYWKGIKYSKEDCEKFGVEYDEPQPTDNH